MIAPWKRALARQRNAGYAEGYAAGLRDAQRVAARYRGAPSAATVARELAELAHTAQLTADAASGRAS